VGKRGREFSFKFADTFTFGRAPADGTFDVFAAGFRALGMLSETEMGNRKLNLGV
jgi:hypothetical protein